MSGKQFLNIVQKRATPIVGTLSLLTLTNLVAERLDVDIEDFPSPQLLVNQFPSNSAVECEAASMISPSHKAKVKSQKVNETLEQIRNLGSEYMNKKNILTRDTPDHPKSLKAFQKAMEVDESSLNYTEGVVECADKQDSGANEKKNDETTVVATASSSNTLKGHSGSNNSYVKTKK